MSKPLQWMIGISSILIAAAVVFAMVAPIFMPGLRWTDGYGMMGRGGMMGGYGMPMFGMGMWLWPLLVIGLIVLGVVWIARSARTPSAAPLPRASATCAHCGQPIQAGWKACPACGEKI